MCGSKGSAPTPSSASTTSATNTSGASSGVFAQGPTPETAARYNAFLDTAGGLAQTPFNPAMLSSVTPINTMQAEGLNELWMRGMQEGNWEPEKVQAIESPYIQDVVGASQDWFNNQNAIQAGDLLSKGIRAGNAFGGDRAGMAEAQLAGQQQLAQAPVIAGLYQAGYTQALDEYNKLKQMGISGAEEAVKAGTVYQAQSQREADVATQNAIMQSAYPFQMANWYGSILGGMGPLTGTVGAASSTSTASSTGITNPPVPNPLNQVLGIGSTLAGLFFKEGGKVGKYDDGGYVDDNYDSYDNYDGDDGSDSRNYDSSFSYGRDHDGDDGDGGRRSSYDFSPSAGGDGEEKKPSNTDIMKGVDTLDKETTSQKQTPNIAGTLKIPRYRQPYAQGNRNKNSGSNNPSMDSLNRSSSAAPASSSGGGGGDDGGFLGTLGGIAKTVAPIAAAFLIKDGGRIPERPKYLALGGSSDGDGWYGGGANTFSDSLMSQLPWNRQPTSFGYRVGDTFGNLFPSSQQTITEADGTQTKIADPLWYKKDTTNFPPAVQPPPPEGVVPTTPPSFTLPPPSGEAPTVTPLVDAAAAAGDGGAGAGAGGGFDFSQAPHPLRVGEVMASGGPVRGYANGGSADDDDDDEEFDAGDTGDRGNVPDLGDDTDDDDGDGGDVVTGGAVAEPPPNQLPSFLTAPAGDGIGAPDASSYPPWLTQSTAGARTQPLGGATRPPSTSGADGGDGGGGRPTRIDLPRGEGPRPRTFAERWAASPFTKAGIAMMTSRSPYFAEGLGRGVAAAAGQIERNRAESMLDQKGRLIASGDTYMWQVGNQLYDLKIPTKGNKGAMSDYQKERIRQIDERNKDLREGRGPGRTAADRREQDIARMITAIQRGSNTPVPYGEARRIAIEEYNRTHPNDQLPLPPEPQAAPAPAKPPEEPGINVEEDIVQPVKKGLYWGWDQAKGIYRWMTGPTPGGAPATAAPGTAGAPAPGATGAPQQQQQPQQQPAPRMPSTPEEKQGMLDAAREKLKLIRDPVKRKIIIDRLRQAGIEPPPELVGPAPIPLSQ